jgi:uncharacterized membrane protein
VRAPLLLLALACGSSEPAGSPPADAEKAADPCADLPLLTWQNVGQGLLRENCQSCHASTSVDRQGAPADITFDTEEQALALRASILRVIDPAAPTMPPAMDLEPAAVEQLEIWLSCAPAAP